MSDQRDPETGRRSLRRIGPLKGVWPFLRRYPGLMALAGFGALGSSLTMLGIGQVVRQAVDRGFDPGEVGALDNQFLALFGVFILLAAFTYLRYQAVTLLGERSMADLRNAVYARVIRLDPAFFERTKIAEVTSRLTVDTELIQTVVGSSASVAARNLLMFVGGLVMLVVTSPKLAGMVLAIMPLVALPIVFFGRRFRRLSRESQGRISQVNACAEESLNAFRTVQAFTQEARETGRFATAVAAALETARRRIRVRAALTAVVILLFFGAVNGVLWLATTDVAQGNMTAGELTAFVFYAILVAGALAALSELWGDLQRAAGAAERVMELLSLAPGIRSPARPAPLPPPHGGIEFRHVVFHYPSRPDDVSLDDFSLQVRPGETVALVGPSGAGKSTVFQLLLRFHDIDSGAVLLGGTDIAALDPVALRGRFGLVMQDPTVFSTTVRENIRYGRPDASEAEVRAAAEAAGVDGFLARLPQGLDTGLGERGQLLSGGERQRIAIARALLCDPDILLLDEATSALDAESIRAVQKALEHLMRGRTCIVIAHRLSTVQNADRIIVMDQGKVVAEGAHEALLARGGLYARLANTQLQDVAESA